MPTHPLAESRLHLAEVFNGFLYGPLPDQLRWLIITSGTSDTEREAFYDCTFNGTE
jgi:hypothetical protein